MTEDKYEIFTNTLVKTRPYEFPDNVHLQVTFEFDLSLYRVDRDVYSILDWIGDIGGLVEGLALFFGGLVALISFNSFDHYMIEYLYQRREFKKSEEATPFTNKKTRLCR